MMGVAEVNAFFERYFHDTAFRLEQLDGYMVAANGNDLDRYLRGEPAPDPARKQPWLDTLRAEREVGKRRYRVTLLSTPLNDYFRFACEWGYALNAEAGEEIFILDTSEVDRPAAVLREDFWLLDDEHVLRMVYDDRYDFAGAEAGDDPSPYRAARDAALAVAEPFTTWWERHPEEHRANRVTV